MLEAFAPAVAQKADLWEIVVTELRRAIVLGELAPGVHLQEPLLAQKFNVSRVPVREALVRLEHEGLVRSEPRRGSFVVGMTPRDVHEVYDLRELLETRAASLAAERATTTQIDELRGLVEEMAAAVGRGDYAATSEPEVAFHRQLVAAADHSRLKAAWEPVAGVIATLLSVTNTTHPDKPATVASHRAIVDALRARDPDAAAAAVARHLRTGERIMQDALKRRLAADAPGADRAAG
jgi:GntR family transcriptional regulator of gluconate operon